jgi:predicted transcriptional regulator
VLAYYFSRENFEAASKSTQQSVGLFAPEEKLRSIPVADVMTKDIYKISDLNAMLTKVLSDLQSKNIKRVPILKQNGSLHALLYLEGIISYMFEIPEADRSKKTIDNLLTEKPGLMQKPAFVGETATLADAKAAMEKVRLCKVVFVTKDGSENDPIFGLLTNTDIAKYSRA